MRKALLLVTLLFAGCESAYYGALEQVGVEKRDILVDRVEEAMEAQEDAKEEFKDALEQFEAVVGIPDSELKAVYNRLSDAFDDAEDRAGEVSGRIDRVQDVAEDLFDEWEQEIEQISSSNLRRKSAAQRRTSMRNYEGLMTAMRRAESRMDPVLTTFRDHVLFLKHNLNAQAISSLRGELGGIETDVGRLIQEMERSIAEAQSFISSFENG